MNRPNLLRTWAAAAAFGLAALTIAQDQPKVTLSMPSAKASAVLAEISKLTGVPLASDPIVGNLPVLVSVSDAPLDQLMQKIADAVGGELKAENGGYRLVNDQAQRREEEAREKGWTITAFDKGKTRALGDMTGTGRWDKKTLDDLVAKAQARQQQLMERINSVERQQGARLTMIDSSAVSMTPASGAAKRALQLLPASVLASVGPGDRFVYATSPTRKQLRMPINVTPIANDFVYNHNMLAQGAPQLRSPQGVEIVGALNSGEPIQGVVDTHLVLSRGYRSTTVSVEIKFVDRNGLYVGQGSVAVSPDYGGVQGSVSAEGKEIALSELSRQMAVIMAQETASATSDRQAFRLATESGGGAFVTMVGGEGGLPKQFPDELLNVFVNPDKFEPTSLYVSESFIQAAQAEGKDLVASFPDTVVRDLARLLVKGPVTSKGLIAASPSFGLTVDATGDWLFVTPTWANSARETRFDRGAAAALYRSVNTRGFATLEELADYSFRLVTGTADRPLDMVYLSLINKDVSDQFNEYASFSLDLLRLYGLIPENAKRQAGEQYATQYRTLTPQGRALADRSYYNRGAGAGMFFGAGQAMSAMVMTMEERAGGRSGPPANSIINEPTEALPNGIPAEALISLRRTLKDGVFASTKGVRGGQLLGAEELGMRQGMLEANIGGNVQSPQYDTFVMAQLVQVELSIELGDYGRPSAMFKDGWLMNNARAMTFGQLPEGFRAEVGQWRSRFTNPRIGEEQRVRIGRGGGG
ncbi:MAG: hypothetical protein WD716_09760 [Fimbriimonadaceae bacterium]